jgi:hypothetical protein
MYSFFPSFSARAVVVFVLMYVDPYLVDTNPEGDYGAPISAIRASA